jgi:hypothetical protein
MTNPVSGNLGSQLNPPGDVGTATPAGLGGGRATLETDVVGIAGNSIPATPLTGNEVMTAPPGPYTTGRPSGYVPGGGVVPNVLQHL